MNGLLPCGLVYIALVEAILSGTIGGSFVWMIAFGLGTIPLMMVAAISGNLIRIPLRNFFKKA